MQHNPLKDNYNKIWQTKHGLTSPDNQIPRAHTYPKQTPILQTKFFQSQPLHLVSNKVAHVPIKIATETFFNIKPQKLTSSSR